MAIRHWHSGKLVILWVWGLLGMGLCYSGLITIDKEKYLIGFFLIGILFAVPLLLSRITWIWLSGKETHCQNNEVVNRSIDDKESSEAADSE